MRRSVADCVIGRSRKFLNGLLGGADKRRRQVIPELVQGILKSGSLVLSRISREMIRGEKTLEGLEKHFSVQLASLHWKDGGLRRRMLQTASAYVEVDTLIAVDLSDIAKPRARKMEGLGYVWDGSEGEVSRGYWTFEAYARRGKGKIIPVLNFAYSLDLPPGRISEVGMVEGAFREMTQVLGERGVYLMDRGFDGVELMSRLEPLKARFVLRLRGDRIVFNEEGEALGSEEELARRTPCPHTCWLPRKGIPIRVGYHPVRLHGLKRPYWLVVAWFPDAETPVMFLTTEPVRSELDAAKIAGWYSARWVVEEAIRVLKQELGLESPRVHSFRAIERLTQLAYLAMLLVTTLLDLPEKTLYRLKRLCPIFERPCNQEYYRLIWGIQALLKRRPTGRIVL